MKRKSIAILAVLLTVAMLLPAAFADTFAVDTDEYALLVSEEGEVFTESGAFNLIFGISPDDCPADRKLFSASAPEDAIEIPMSFENASGSWDYVGYEYPACLMNAKGEMLTLASYSYLVHYPEFERVVGERMDSMMDVLDEKGNLLFSGAFSAVVPTSADTYLAIAANPDAAESDSFEMESGAMFLLDAAGNAVDTGYVASPYGISCANGLANILVYEQENDAWVYYYFNAEGKPAFDMAFGYAEHFHENGYAVVSSAENGLYGIIDTNGNWVVEAKYQYLTHSESLENSVYIAQENDFSIDFLKMADLSSLFSYVGDEINYVWATQYSSDLIGISNGSLTEIYDCNGTKLLTLDDYRYVDGYSFLDLDSPQAVIVSEGDYPYRTSGIADLQGNFLCNDFQDLSCAYWLNGKGVYMAVSYDVISYEYDGEEYEDMDFDSYRVGLVDQNGNILLPIEYDTLYPISYDRFWATKGNEYGIVDSQGNWYCVFTEYSESDIQGE